MDPALMAQAYPEFDRLVAWFCEAYRNGELPHYEEAIKLKFQIGRNDPCPCGSGKKYKKCCLKEQS